MEIINNKGNSLPAVTSRSIFIDDGKILPAGSKVSIGSAEDVGRYGGMGNLNFCLPERGTYVIVVTDTYRDATAWTSRPRLKSRHYEAGDTIELTAEQALHLMLSGGRVKPAPGSDVADIRSLAPFTYKPPIDTTRAASPAQQRIDREREERKQADKERGIFQAQLETGRVPVFIKGWKK
jgi:hypothetical protein